MQVWHEDERLRITGPTNATTNREIEPRHNNLPTKIEPHHLPTSVEMANAGMLIGTWINEKAAKASIVPAL